MASVLALSQVSCSPDSPQSLIASGKQFVAKKDPRSAVIQFKSALQIDPQSVEARYLLGQAMLDSEDPAGAVVELSKAFDQKYDPNKVLPPLARAMLLAGDGDKLSTLYGEVSLEDKLAMASLKSSVAAAWGLQNKVARSEAAIAAALQAVPDFGPALLLRARIMASHHEVAGAMRVVEQVLAREPNLYEGWQVKGEIQQVLLKNPDAALESFAKALSLERAYVPAHTAIIAVRLAANDIAGAKAQAEQLRKVLPKHPQTMFIDAQIAFVDRDVKKAREIAQQLMRLAPTHQGVLQLAGAIEAQSGSLVMAETFLNKALQLNPDLPLARRVLAQTYLKLGQPAKALETLKSLLAADPPDALALSLAGDARQQLGDTEGAELMFRQVAKIDPSDTRAQTAIALGKLARGNTEAGFAELETLARNSKDVVAERALVSLRLKRKEFDAALALVDGMAKKLPDDATVMDLRGRVLLARKDYPAARAAFEQALKTDPTLLLATSNLAAVDLIEKKPRDAEKRFEAAIQADARNHYARMALATLREGAGAPMEEVRKILEDAVKAAPSEAEPRLQLIELLLRKRLYKDALTAAQEAAAALSNDLRVLDAVGRAQMQAGSPEQAIVTFRRLAGLDPGSAATYLRLADVYRATGKRDSLESSLKKALEVDPDLMPARTSLVDFLLSSDRPKDALGVARAEQTRRPKSDAGYVLEGVVHLRAKMPDAALEVYRKGMAAVGEGSELPAISFVALSHLGRTPEADKFALGWLKDHPGDVGLEYQLAESWLGRGDAQQAEQRLRHVVSLRPQNALALNNLAAILARRGDPAALEFAQRAAELAPGVAGVADTLAMALAAQKQFDKALMEQKRAVELDPKDNGLRLGLARIALQAGDKELARKEIERLQALGPAFARQGEVAKLKSSL
jgi:putative PEP-CTERM system TPR-repeat lipoprotein